MIEDVNLRFCAETAERRHIILEKCVFTQTFTYINKCWSLMHVIVRLAKNCPSAKGGGGREVDVIAGERTERRLLIIKKNGRS